MVWFSSVTFSTILTVQTYIAALSRIFDDVKNTLIDYKPPQKVNTFFH